MLEAKYRPQFQSIFIEPIALKVFKYNWMTPNQITLISCISGCVVPLALYYQSPIIAIMLLLISGYCDVLDGSVARLHENTQAIGSLYDIVSDRLVEFMVVMGLFLIDMSQRGIYCLLMLGSILICVSSFLVVGILTENQTEKGFYYSPGLMERAEAFIFFIAMMLWPAYFSSLSIVFSVLVFWTAWVRVRDFNQQSQHFS